MGWAGRVVCAGLLLLPLGCSERVLLVPHEGETRAALFALQTSTDRRLTAAALEGGDAFELSIDAADLVFALLFSESLEQLGLEPGEVPLASANVPYSRALPPTPHVFFFEHDRETFEPASPDQIRSLEAFRIQDLTPVECVSKGGCYGVSDQSRCTIPCPAPTPIEAPNFTGEPDQPAPPQFAPCPSGWRTVVSAESNRPETCEPFALGAETSCGPFEAWFLGDTACSEVGDPCPSGEWPLGLPVGSPVFYVKADAPPGGDGSLASPYQTIGEAIAQSSPGGSIALAAGDYRESIDLPVDVHVVGVCAERVRIVAPSPSDPVVRARGGSLANLRLVGGAGALVGEASASLEVRGVIVEDTEGAEGAAISLAEGTVLGASELLVRRSAGDAISAIGASFELSRVVMTDVAQTAVRAASSTVTVSDLTVSAVGLHSIWADQGSTVRLERFVLHPSAEQGLLIEDGSRGLIDGGVLRGTPAVESERFRIAIRDGSALTASRILLEGADRSGIFVHSSTVTLSDSWVDVRLGAGLFVTTASVLELDRVRIDDAGLSSVIHVPDGVVRISDLAVVRSVPVRPDYFQNALRMSGSSSQLELRRVRIEGAYNPGVYTLVSNAVDVSDLTIVEAVGGFEVDSSSFPPRDITVRRLLIQDSSGMGLLIGGNATIEDARIRGSGGGSIGVDSDDALVASLHRIEIENAHGFGLQLSDGTTSVFARDLRIVKTRRQSCGSFLLSEDCLGSAISALKGARLEAERFTLEENVIGISLLVDVLGQTGEVDLADGVMERNESAVLASHPDYALERLFRRVVLRDNGRLVEHGSP